MKAITRDKEGHFITTKGLIHQEDITIMNIYAPDNRARRCMKQKLTEVKGERDNSTIVGDFSTSLSAVDRTTRQKSNKETEGFNNYKPILLTDLYRTFLQMAAENNFLSTAHETFSRIENTPRL